MLSMGYCQGLYLLPDASTGSIFPKVRAWLDESADHQNALEFVAQKKNMERYNDTIDFLFCELYPKWRTRCFKFYDGDGPLLKEYMTQAEIDTYHRALLMAVHAAYKLFCDDRRLSWYKFKFLVHRMAA